ncbi:neprilysin-2 isoform X1 [Microplitis demolitor]|uniref:neprilysin-2 isoform X1 n=2 Tax=Microplitis demolitor TaxID=69319 RepID=UPI0006D52807|nr:neprilysin-2 isoform X1 [Microplitis demolitor]
MRASWFILFLSVMAAEHVNDKIKSIYDSCTTRQCFLDLMEFELKIFNNINMSVDPCDNFYEFACGNFDNNPSDLVQQKEHRNFFEVSDIFDRMEHLIQTSDSSHLSRPFNLLKNYMTACCNMNNNHVYSYNKLDYLNELISKLGGWPLLQGDKWNETNFDWIDFVHKAQENGVDYDVFIIKGLWHHGNFTQFLSLSPPNVELDHKEDNKLNFDKLTAYVNFVTDVAEFLGANRTLTKRGLKKSVIFEMKLYNISNNNNTFSLTNGNKTYGMSVKEAIEKWPCIDWIKLLNPPMLPRPYFTNESIIFIQNRDFITRFEKLLKKTPKKVLANYAMWKTIQNLIPFVHSTTLIRLLSTYYQTVRLPSVFQLPSCSSSLQDSLKELKLSHYVHHYPLDGKVKSRVNLMALDVRQKLISIINRTNTLDDESRNKLIRDIDSIELILGYPEVLLDDKKMEEYYQGLEITSADFLKSFYNALVFKFNKQFVAALKPSDEVSWKDILNNKIVTTSNGFNIKHSHIIVLGILILEIFFLTSIAQIIQIMVC